MIVDVLGNLLHEGDYVAFSLYEESRMQIGRIIGFTEKQAKVAPLLIIDPKNRRSAKKLNQPYLLRKPKHIVKVEITEDFKNIPADWVGKVYRK